MRTRIRTLHLATGLALLAFSSTSFAQADADRATARLLGHDGEAALAAKDYKAAEDDFRRADSLVHAPTLLLGLARALAAEGKWVEAQEAYNRIIREGVTPGAPDVFRKAVEDAKAEVPAIAPRLGSVTISVVAAGGGDVPSPKVTLDDAPVSAASLGVKRVANPGGHVVKVSADGFKSATVTVNVTAGTNSDAPVSLEKDSAVPAGGSPVPTTPGGPGSGTPTAGGTDLPSPTSSGASPWPWVAFGLGGVGLGTGIVTGIVAIMKHSDLSTSCKNGTCSPAQQSDLDTYNTVGLVSTIGFVVAGVGAAAGVTLLLLHPKNDAPVAAALVVGPGSLSAVGRF
jgi:hypothetical protein